MSVSGFVVRDLRDSKWEGKIHLDRSSAEAHVEEVHRFSRMVCELVIEAAEVDFIPDQRVTVHGWHVGYQFNRRSMGKRTIKSGPVRELRLLGDRVVGVAYYDGIANLDRVPVVLLRPGVWSSYSLGDSGEIITVEG